MDFCSSYVQFLLTLAAESFYYYYNKNSKINVNEITFSFIGFVRMEMGTAMTYHGLE